GALRRRAQRLVGVLGMYAGVDWTVRVRVARKNDLAGQRPARQRVVHDVDRVRDVVDHRARDVELVHGVEQTHADVGGEVGRGHARVGDLRAGQLDGEG